MGGHGAACMLASVAHATGVWARRAGSRRALRCPPGLNSSPFQGHAVALRQPAPRPSVNRKALLPPVRAGSDSASPRSWASASSASLSGTTRAPRERWSWPISTARHSTAQCAGVGRMRGRGGGCRRRHWRPGAGRSAQRRWTAGSGSNGGMGRRSPRSTRTRKLDVGAAAEHVLDGLRLHILAVEQHNGVLGAPCRAGGGTGGG